MSSTEHPAENMSRAQVRRRAHIVEAALKIFERDGFEAARMIDIADEADVAKGTLYLYFENKTALLEGVIQTEILPTIAAIGEALEDFQGSAKDALVRQIETTARRMASPSMKILLKLMITAHHQNPEIANFYYKNVLQPGLNIFQQTLEKGIEAGEFKPHVKEMHPVTLLGAHVFTGVWNILFTGSEELDIDQLIEGFTRSMFEGMLVDAD